MDIPEFKSVDTLRKLWWLHDSFWHAALVKELGFERANRINFEVASKIGRMITNQLLRSPTIRIFLWMGCRKATEKVIQRPRSIQDLMSIFKIFWKNTFFDGLYINDPITYDGNTATWIGTRCHVYDSVRKGRMLEGYECGCQAVRSASALYINLIEGMSQIDRRGDEGAAPQTPARDQGVPGQG